MIPGFESNAVLDKLPAHLLQFVKPQHYDSYTAIDQAVWRYVMSKNVRSLSEIAHESYLAGLEQTGISTERIPSMYGMNRILAKIGWAAVAVDGLIPTEAFLEFQAYNVLVIASEIRTLQDIEYTPIPDIIHESAGHAPIIANPEYAEFLRRMGQIGCRAIPSSKDRRLHEAVRQLTELKESPSAVPAQLEQASRRVVALQDTLGTPSELTAIRNLHWWSVEYGLIGTVAEPKIYGAGLLSSIGESQWCMREEVRKVPYTVEAANQHFDYTKPQPQLFVTPNFAHLSYVLEKYANTMALRTGGGEALSKLIDGGVLGTIELSTGIQISGTFTRVILDEKARVSYFFLDGPTALSYREKEVIGHGVKDHPNGYGSPVGKLQGINIAIEDMSPRDLEAYDIYEGRRVTLEFASGVVVQGEVITGIRNLQGKIILIRFKHCTVRYHDEILFEPTWGIYDMAVGKEVVSGYAGPADLDSFDLITHEIKDDYVPRAPSDRERAFGRMHAFREGKEPTSAFESFFELVESTFADEWLLLLEAFEYASTQGMPDCGDRAHSLLMQLINRKPDVAHLIRDGLELIGPGAMVQDL